jgi:hypothetical protein
MDNLQTIFLNGKMVNEYTFEEVRANAKENFMKEFGNDVLALLTNEPVPYTDLKSKIDAKTNYGVNTNGAYQILSNLNEYGYVTLISNPRYRGKMQVASDSSWKKK